MRVLPTIASARSHLQRARAVKASSFEYTLPPHRIAERPLADRSSSKLLVVDLKRNGSGAATLSDRVFRDLPHLLSSGSLLVRNASRVIPARLPMRKRTGGRAEVLLLRPAAGSGATPSEALSTPASRWHALVGGRRVREGDVLMGGSVRAQVVHREEGEAACVVDLWTERGDLRSALGESGETPLPPYIARTRASDAADRTAYQTVYAHQEGSAAAPTAGLHMTRELEAQLRGAGVDTVDVTLHVGAGTFAPLGGERAGDHCMHVEHVHVAREALESIARQASGLGGTVALGTTSVRTLESLYWLGVRELQGYGCANALDVPEVGQWEPYEYMDQLGEDGLPSAGVALEALLNSDLSSQGVLFKTKLLIVPGYSFHMVDALITNFHQPRSTLLMLVAAFAGDESILPRVYSHALTNSYRFLSYGDSSLYRPRR